MRVLASARVRVVGWPDGCRRPRPPLWLWPGGPADPSHELGCALFEFGRTDPGRVRALAGAYRDAGGPATVVRRGHFSMLIAQLGHITEAAGSDWLEPNPRSPERADSAAWIGEVLDEPYSRALLDTILEAARTSWTVAEGPGR